MTTTTPEMVNAGWAYIQGQAAELMTQAEASLTALQQVLGEPEHQQITYSPNVPSAGQFIRPTAPVPLEIDDINVDFPDDVDLNNVSLGVIPDPPSEPSFEAMVYRPPAAPTVAPPNRPADTDVPLIEIEIPDAPTYQIPDDPTLYEINIPEIDDLVVPEFAGVRPTITLEAPQHTFAWQYEAYDSTFIDVIRAKLSAMTINGLALPPEIEQAIFDRARGREDTLSAQQIAAAESSLAARGLRQPAGLLARAIERVRQQQRQQASTASRDLAIAVAKENVESIRFALSQGIAMESAFIQSHIAAQTLSLEGAKATQAAVIDIFNGEVALHNAQWEGFKAEASVYESRIRALVAQVELIRARIEAEKVKGDVNEGLIRAYAERVRALSAIADMHRSQVEAAKAKGEINVQRLEQARLRIQTYQIDVDAWGRQWDAYRTAAEAEAQGLRYWETLGNLYATRVNTWRGRIEAEDARARTQIATNTQRIEAFRATLASVTAQIQGQSATADARARVHTANAGMYAAEGQVSAAAANAWNDGERIKLEGARIKVDVQRANAELSSNIALKRIDQSIEALRGAAQIWSQLAAAVMSGMNFNASMSASGSSSVSTNYNYDMTA